MTPKDGPRDWDKELADIDKLIASAPAPAQVPARTGKPEGKSAKAGAGAAAPVAPLGRRDRLTSWMWLSLAVLLGAGLGFFWPYDRTCGLPLYGYLASIGAFGVASLWSTMWSWRTRAGLVHFVSIALLFGAAFLGAREVLPRIGYAKRAAIFECPAPPAPAPAAPVGSTKLDSVPAAAVPPAVPGITPPGAPAPTAAPAPATAPAGQTKAPKP